MKYSIIISEIAEQEISEAFFWYEDQKDDLGSVFKQGIYQVIDKISNNPFVFQIRYLDVRIAFLYKFPYGIHYTLNYNIITIIGVYHTSRNPKKWIDNYNELR